LALFNVAACNFLAPRTFRFLSTVKASLSGEPVVAVGGGGGGGGAPRSSVASSGRVSAEAKALGSAVATTPAATTKAAKNTTGKTVRRMLTAPASTLSGASATSATAAAAAGASVDATAANNGGNGDIDTSVNGDVVEIGGADADDASVGPVEVVTGVDGVERVKSGSSLLHDKAHDIDSDVAGGAAPGRFNHTRFC
jgi:hypothetical protein